MVAEVAPGLYRLPGVGLGVNAYVWHPHPEQRREGEPVLFDCGWPWSGQGLAASLVALGCQTEDIRSIAITHDDVDHTGRLAPLQSVSGADVYAHHLEATRLAGTDWRMPPGNSGPVNWIAGVANALYARWPHHGVAVTHPLEDGDRLPGGWMAVHTPGHTPGHTSYFHPEGRILIAGDALGLWGGGKLRAPMPVYTEDTTDSAESVRKLATLQPEIICFGHRQVLYNAAGALNEFARSLEHPGAGW